MAQVPSLPLDESIPTERASHRRIRQMSRLLSIAITVLLALAVLAPLTLTTVAAVRPNLIGCNASGCELGFPLPPGYSAVSEWPLITRVAGVADLAMAALAPCFVLFNLRRLFQLYARGSVFARENAETIRHIGLWLLLYLPLKFLSNWVFVITGGPDHAWLHATGIYAFILGAIVMFIAQVMAFGHEIEKEHSEFV